MIKTVDCLSALPAEIQEKCQSANVFYEEEYAEYLREVNSSTVVYLYSECFVQIVEIHTIKRVFKTASLPSEPFALQEKFTFADVQEFLDEVLTVLQKNYCIDWQSVTPASSLFQCYPTHSKRIKFGNYIIDLEKSEEELFSSLDSKHRNMVRRGQKGEVQVKFGSLELLDDYMLLDRQTWARSGQAADHTDFYKTYVEHMPKHTMIGIAYKDGMPQCGLLGLYNAQMFYYMFGASADCPEPGSTHLLQWQNIIKMKDKGVKAYSFVGARINEDPDSKLHNIQHFKKGFGGSLVECYLFKTTLSSVKKALFEVLLKWRTGKTSDDVIDQELHKWRDIND